MLNYELEVLLFFTTLNFLSGISIWKSGKQSIHSEFGTNNS